MKTILVFETGSVAVASHTEHDVRSKARSKAFGIFMEELFRVSIDSSEKSSESNLALHRMSIPLSTRFRLRTSQIRFDHLAIRI